MNKKNKYKRRLRNIIYKIGYLINPGYAVIKGLSIPEFKKRINYLSSEYKKIISETSIKKLNAGFQKQVNLLFELEKIIKEYNVSDEELLKIWKQTRHKKIVSNILLSHNTLSETRDNKYVYVGSGGSNKNKIRYPSMKRSKSTWKKFYKLFPNAEKRVKV
jgi:hypothetical protein